MAKGDEETFDAFFRASHRRLLGQAYLFTADSALAQDLTQEALERTWRKWKTVSTLEDPEGWTRRVLHNLCISAWRKHSRRREIQGFPPADVAPPDVDHLTLVAALRTLSPDQAKALVLHDGLGFSVPEIALELAVPAGTVKSWISRGRTHAAATIAGSRHLEKGGSDNVPVT